MRRKLIAGNWKMHGTHTAANELIGRLTCNLSQDIDVVVFPPLCYAAELASRYSDVIDIGSQDVSEHITSGAFTGEVAASMLADIGCAWALVGHSECRRFHHETNAQVANKFAAVVAAGMTPLLCIGETLEQREAGRARHIIAAQIDAVTATCGIDALKQAVIGYEPVWAIGTGHSASPEMVQRIHSFIRDHLAALDTTASELARIVYGGSVNPSNASALFNQKDIDGVLIGGASLVPADFLAICDAAHDAARL